MSARRSGINAVALATKNIRPVEKMWIRKYRGITRIIVQLNPCSSRNDKAKIKPTIAGVIFA